MWSLLFVHLDTSKYWIASVWFIIISCRHRRIRTSRVSLLVMIDKDCMKSEFFRRQSDSKAVLNDLFLSSKEAPLTKIILMWCLKAHAIQTSPFWVHIAVFHFYSSLSSESASLTILRSLANMLQRQSVKSAICLSIILDGLVLFMPALAPIK